MDPLKLLPVELLDRIFGGFSTRELLKSILVCREWYRAAIRFLLRSPPFTRHLTKSQFSIFLSLCLQTGVSHLRNLSFGYRCRDQAEILRLLLESKITTNGLRISVDSPRVMQLLKHGATSSSLLAHLDMLQIFFGIDPLQYQGAHQLFSAVTGLKHLSVHMVCPKDGTASVNIPAPNVFTNCESLRFFIYYDEDSDNIASLGKTFVDNFVSCNRFPNLTDLKLLDVPLSLPILREIFFAVPKLRSLGLTHCPFLNLENIILAAQGSAVKLESLHLDAEDPLDDNLTHPEDPFLESPEFDLGFLSELKSLSLTQCFLSVMGLLNLLRATNGNLTRLSLAYSWSINFSTFPYSSMLGLCPNLEALIMIGCYRFDDRACRKLAKALVGVPVRSLDLSYNPDLSVLGIRKLLEVDVHVQRVVFGGNNKGGLSCQEKSLLDSISGAEVVLRRDSEINGRPHSRLEELQHQQQQQQQQPKPF